MNRENNSLDGFLHESVENAQFAFKEEYWDKMTVLLDEEEKNKKRPFFWRWLSALLLVAIAGGATFIYQFNQSKVDSRMSKVESRESKVESRESIIESNESKEGVSLLNEEHSSKNEEYSSKNEEHLSKNEKHLSKNEKQLSKNEEHSSKNEERSSKNEERSSKNEERLSKNEEHSSKNEEHSSKNEERSSKNEERSSKKNNDLKKNKVEGWKGLKRSLTEKVSLKSLDVKQKTTAKTVVINGKEMLPIDTVVYTQRAYRDESIYNPRYIASLKNYVPEKYDSITILTYKPVAEDISKPAEAKKPNKEKAFFEPQRMNLFCSLGINLNKGFEGNIDNQTKWNVAPFVGIGLEKSFSNKISMASQVGFTYFNGLNMKKTISGNQYSFGLDSTSVSVYNKTMYQLYLPINLYYQFIKNHFVMIGVGGNYSLNVSSKFEEIKGSSTGFNASTQTANKNFATTTKNNQLGYVNGFNNLDIFLQAGYSYQAFRTLAFQIGVQQGLFDMTKNSYFNNTIKNTQTRFSLGIKYSFKRNNE